MKELTIYETDLVYGADNSISPECFNAVNLYSYWWFYGQLTLEVFSVNFISYCNPGILLLIDGTPLKVIACLPEEKALAVTLICQR